ncbi:uncharacterized protein LOC119673153 [Teleopsis dalmanni]|uniref:uncharacterized protein LOC119673153 n=1 Tax=Teleopsis dalmanni TaxID=139649 RepID=UPI0018CCF86C|nr:uncharacterized protein LOC119673153 [Teleopsis dalmanni]
MAKLFQILLVSCFVLALCTAEAPRVRSIRFQNQRRSRVLARQEVAEEAVTPYPSAAELKPELPFNEADNSEPAALAPEDNINVPEVIDNRQPDLTYGPPEAETDDIPVDEEEEQDVLPAEEAVADVAPEDEPAEEVAVDEQQSERLTRGRRINSRKSARPAKLRAAPKAKSARLQQQPLQQQVQPQFVAQPVFFYTAQLRNW